MFLFAFAIGAFALNTYTFTLSQFYTLGLGYSSLSAKNIALSPNIPQRLKCNLTASNLRYGSFELADKKIYITIKSSSESSTIQNKLRSSSLFELDNFRSRRNLDGTYYIYLQLKTREAS